MKTTIEQINGVPHTVVWHDERYAQGDQLDFCCEIYTDKHFRRTAQGLILALHKGWSDPVALHIATALPPLPRKPTVKDADLLYLYTAHGLRVYLLGEWRGACGFGYPLKEPEMFVGFVSDDYDYSWETTENSILWDVEITHATDKDGNRVEIAIKEQTDVK